MQQPVPKVSREDVRRIIQRDFPSEEDFVTELLNEYSPDSLAADRVHLAILKLSEGDLDRLFNYLGVACRDFRDVLSPAEYPLHRKYSWTELKELTEAERALIYEEDWRQYQEWLQRK